MIDIDLARGSDENEVEDRSFRLLSPGFWDAPLARFARATGLVVSLYDVHLRRRSGPHKASPLAESLYRSGFWDVPGIGSRSEADLAARCMAENAVFSTTFHGALGLCAFPTHASGEVIGAFVLGWVPSQFVDPVASNRIASAVGIQEMEIWQVMRMQVPMTGSKMLLYVEMLQNFAEVMLQQLEVKESDLEQAKALRTMAESATELSGARTAQGIGSALINAVRKLVPGAGITFSVIPDSGARQTILECPLDSLIQSEMVSERSLKVPIKSATQGLLGMLEIKLPRGHESRPMTTELLTLAAQAAVALQKTRLIDDLSFERTSLDKANIELRNLHVLKDEFLATISHELRTPLNSILGWSQMMCEGMLEPDEVHDAIAAIERNAVIQSKLVEDLLDVSRIISGKLVLDREIVNLSAILKNSVETVRPAAESKLQSLDVSYPDEPLVIRGDATRLQQVFWNILSNATKFTPEGGRIKLTGEKIGAYVNITIKDNGKGISKEFLPHLFERFSQADCSHSRAYGGLGLGLAIVRHLVELHGGSVTASSDGDGMGTTFAITLPINITDAELESARAVLGELGFGKTSGRQKLAGVKILVVDDELDSLRLVKFILEKSGATVVAVENSSAAYDEVVRWRPDLIVSDISMPGEDGYTFLKRVRDLPAENGGATPAFVISAVADPKARGKSLASGYQRHFSKPLDVNVFLSSVIELLSPP